jgi:hypothetical protein
MNFLFKSILFTILILNVSFMALARDTFIVPSLNIGNNSIPVCEKKSSKILPSWLSNGRQYGKWWLRRSKDYEPTDAILYNIIIKYNFDHSTGSEEVKKHKLKSSLALRKKKLSNYVMYSLKKKETEYRTSRIQTEKQTFEDLIFIEALNFMDVLIGYKWLTDDKKYYLNRFNYYGGLYFTLLNTKKLIFKIGVYYGHDRIEYMNELSELLGKQKEDFKNDFVYANQKLNWFITDTITLSEKLKYRSYIGETDYVVNTTFDLDIAITKNISLNASYEIDRDTTDSDNNLGLSLEDKDFSLGIKLMF